MSYVSNNLCHFVGRSLATDDERFELLIKIIRGRVLKANVIDFGNPQIANKIEYSCDRVGEVYQRCDCVCFCDIPDNKLQIHTSKYSEFGMGFHKSYLAERGVRPVMYVPMGATMKEPAKTCSPKENPVKYFGYLEKLTVTLGTILSKLNIDVPFSQQFIASFLSDDQLSKGITLYDPAISREFVMGNAHGLMYAQTSAMLTHLAYVKIFDENLSQDDPENYYMEREWRVLQDVEFDCAAVMKVYLPSGEYKERFLREIPEYTGAFWIFDEHRSR